MNSDLPAQRLANGILIGNLIIAGLGLGSLLMLGAAVWLAAGS
ncbi:MAG: hypothetical protein AB7O88_17360 [Reyranellaceae bacterium]